MRTKDEGGNIFTLCDKHWDEALEKPEHLKLCAEKPGFICCSCGLVCCDSHGIQTPGAIVVTGSLRRCTPCADGGR